MRKRDLALISAALLAGAFGGSLIGPHTAEAVNREMVELQQSVAQLLQGQKDLATAMTQDHTVLKTLVQQSSSNVDKLNSTMGSLQKSVQDVQANSGARLDTMSTQVQGLSDNLEEIKSRLGKLNQQLTDVQNIVQSLDAKISSGGAPAPGSTGVTSNPPSAMRAVPPGAGGTAAPSAASPSGAASAPSSSTVSSASPAPSADTLYDNALRDVTTGKYDLAKQEFQDYLKYYPDTQLASNAQFYLGEIAFIQHKYDDSIAYYNKVIVNYPKSFKIASARYRKGRALIELGKKNEGIRELREVIRRYPGSEEERQARAKLKELGAPVSDTR